MSKEEYIKKIVELLEQCNQESVLYFVKGFLEKQAQ